MVATPRPTDIRIEDVRCRFVDHVYRAPYKFGGRIVDRVTLLDVRCRLTTRNGRTAWGFASMTLGNMWAFPSEAMGYDATLDAMKVLADRIRRIALDCPEIGHPLDLARALEPEYMRAAAAVSKDLALSEPIPKLCTLVVASPFDAAIHDAFGKVHTRNVYDTYGPDLMTHDLGHYLGPAFAGARLDTALQWAGTGARPYDVRSYARPNDVRSHARPDDVRPYALPRRQERLPVFHSVGALDPLEGTDVHTPIGDGLPETLAGWMERDGLVRLKIKLNGDDLSEDVARTLAIDRVAASYQSARNVDDLAYCLDFNERCPDVDYVLECLHRIRAAAPDGFARLLYIEQPTARDLAANTANVVHEAARLCPVVIDESLTDLESLLLAREMGYTGVALKACKGQSHAVLMAAAAQAYGMFVCVQDLTCPGASLIHSVGIAAHVPAVAGIEANARQYVPTANQPWEARFPGIFAIRDGHIETADIGGPGLGIPDDMIDSF